MSSQEVNILFLLQVRWSKRLSVRMNQAAHQAAGYAGFSTIRRLGSTRSISAPPGWDASPSQGAHQH